MSEVNKFGDGLLKGIVIGVIGAFVVSSCIDSGTSPEQTTSSQSSAATEPATPLCRVTDWNYDQQSRSIKMTGVTDCPYETRITIVVRAPDGTFIGTDWSYVKEGGTFTLYVDGYAPKEGITGEFSFSQ